VLAVWFPLLAPDGVVDDGALAACLARVQGDDEPHTVAWSPGERATPGAVGAPHRRGEPDDAVGLGVLLRGWAPRLRSVSALFPVAGDVSGVPAAVSAPAVDAEECVLVTLEPVPGADPGQDAAPGRGADGSSAWALVPETTPFGSALEQGHLVRWSAVPVPPWERGVLAAVGDLREAERHLRAVLIGQTEALDALDVTSWTRSTTEVLSGLAGYRALADLVPDDLAGPRARALSESARLRYVVETAVHDEGGAVTLWQAGARSAALRQVDEAARHAMAAATFVAQRPASTDS